MCGKLNHTGKLQLIKQNTGKKEEVNKALTGLERVLLRHCLGLIRSIVLVRFLTRKSIQICPAPNTRLRCSTGRSTQIRRNERSNSSSTKSYNKRTTLKIIRADWSHMLVRETQNVFVIIYSLDNHLQAKLFWQAGNGTFINSLGEKILRNEYEIKDTNFLVTQFHFAASEPKFLSSLLHTL